MARRSARHLVPGDSAIVSVVAADDVAERRQRAGIVGSVRAGRLRLAFHLNNSDEDADVAARALAGRVKD